MRGASVGGTETDNYIVISIVFGAHVYYTIIRSKKEVSDAINV
jgi:hypothetical protein